MDNVIGKGADNLGKIEGEIHQEGELIARDGGGLKLYEDSGANALEL